MASRASGMGMGRCLSDETRGNPLFTLALVAGFFILCAIIDTLFIHQGAQWARLPRPGYLRSLMIYGSQTMIGFSVCWFVAPHLPSPAAHESAWAMLVFALLIFVSLFLITIWVWQGGSLGRVFRAWLVSLVGQALLLAFFYVIVKPYIFASFAISANSMSPNMRGSWTARTCPECGKSLIVTAPDPDLPPRAWRGRLGGDVPAVCESCYRAERMPAPENPDHAGDHIICNKLKKPARWNIVCFRFPLDREPDPCEALDWSAGRNAFHSRRGCLDQWRKATASRSTWSDSLLSAAA